MNLPSMYPFKTLTTGTKKQTTKFSSANFQKTVKPKVHHIEGVVGWCDGAG